MYTPVVARVKKEPEKKNVCRLFSLGSSIVVRAEELQVEQENHLCKPHKHNIVITLAN